MQKLEKKKEKFKTLTQGSLLSALPHSALTVATWALAPCRPEPCRRTTCSRVVKSPPYALPLLYASPALSPLPRATQTLNRALGSPRAAAVPTKLPATEDVSEQADAAGSSASPWRSFPCLESIWGAVDSRRRRSSLASGRREHEIAVVRPPQPSPATPSHPG